MGYQVYCNDAVIASKIELPHIIERLTTHDIESQACCEVFEDWLLGHIRFKQANLSEKELYTDVCNHTREGDCFCYVSACGKPVAYNIFKPEFKEVYYGNVFGDYTLRKAKEKLNGSQYSYVIYLPEPNSMCYGHTELYGEHLKECKDYALDYIFKVPDRSIEILNVKNSRVYQVSMLARRVQSTSKKSIEGQYIVEPVYKYNFALTYYGT